MTFLDMIETYNIVNGNDLNDIESIFKDIELDERLDKSTLAGVLLDECGAMRCIYETTASFKYFSDLFFKKYAWNITKLVNSLHFEYDPLKNKNMEWTETTEIEQNLDTEENREKNNTGTEGTVFTETNTISAMNSSTYQPDNQREGNSTRTDNLKETNDSNKNENLTWDETDTHKENGLERMPYQDLIEKERKVSQFNIYMWIADKYSSELFLMVY
ncbi:MAG: hypothetical protein J6S85_22385 [Methanobrevibacter sp.]|nr:hypothetical protein [Methanobrevibacter sp.]